MKVAVVGATGMVGQIMLDCLSQRSFPVSELIPVASKRSVGQMVLFNNRDWPIVSPATALKKQPKIALFSAGSAVSERWAQKFAHSDCRVIDNSSFWRMHPEVKLIVPEINSGVLTKQYMLNKGNFRKYVHEQAFLAVPPLLIKAAQELIPSIELSDIEQSNKVAIRSQLFNRETQRLEDDFQCLPGPNSTHILNAISPAFTASFELADLILEKSKLGSKEP